jgi:hypothetical protein
MQNNKKILKFITSQTTWRIRFKYLLFYIFSSLLKKTKIREVQKNDNQGAVSDDAYPLM